MMAEMIATYPAPRHEPRSRADRAPGFAVSTRRPLSNPPGRGGGGYLNEVRSR